MFSKNVNDIIDREINNLGFDLVMINHFDNNKKTISSRVQIIAEPKEKREMTITDCVKISKHISKAIDLSQPNMKNLVLEVSSPGLDRPLFKIEDYLRFQGYRVKIKLKNNIDGGKKFKGKLLKDNSTKLISLETEDGIKKFDFNNIEKGKIDIDQFFIKSI